MSDPVPRLKRLLNMIPLLRRSEGITVGELAKLLKMPRKEVVEDLKRLNFVGVPPYEPHDYISVLFEGEKVWIDFADHWKRPAALTLREALALKLAVEALPPGDQSLEGAREELRLALDRLLRKQRGGAELSSELEGSLTSGSSEATREKLARLHEAARRRRAVDIIYYSASSEATAPRRVRPLGLAESSGNHYLVAFDEGKRDIRHFRVDRISSLEEPKGLPAFERPPGFDLEAFVRTGFGPRVTHPVKLRFDARIARFAKEDYDNLPHESLPSGDLAVEIQAGSVTWAVSRTLSYGEHAEILSPNEAREDLKQRLTLYLSKQGAKQRARKDAAS